METQLPTPPIPTPKPKSPILWILLSVVIGTSLSAAGYFGYRYYREQTAPEPIPEPIEAEEMTPSPTATSDPTADWQTYTNQKLGFSFKYPNSYQLLKDESSGAEFGFKLPADTAAFPYLKIAYTHKTTISSLVLCKENTSKFPCKSATNATLNITINNIDATSTYITKGTVDSDFRIVQLSNPKIELEMNISGGGLDRTFDQILSTFKFTNPTPNSTDKAKFCGGIAGLPCPEGYSCKLDGSYPDAGGTCIKDPKTNTSYTCPASGWVDCMPSPDGPKTECSQEALEWYKANCPNFQGAAL